jgi:hypothetical protein
MGPPDGGKIGPALGYKRDEKVMEVFGGHDEYVDTPGTFVPP